MCLAIAGWSLQWLRRDKSRCVTQVECVAAMKEVLGDEVGLALDCGPGIHPSDLLRLAQVITAIIFEDSPYLLHGL